MDEELKTYLDTKFAGIDTKFAAIDAKLIELKEYVDERTHDAETRLLRGFADYNSSTGVRMRKLEADVSNVNTSSTTRLGNLENKITDLEIRLIKLEGNPPSHSLPS